VKSSWPEVQYRLLHCFFQLIFRSQVHDYCGIRFNGRLNKDVLIWTDAVDPKQSYLDLRCAIRCRSPRLRELCNARAARPHSRAGARCVCPVFAVVLVQNKIKFGVYLPGLKNKDKRRVSYPRIKRSLVSSENGPGELQHASTC
jgi:hypothetical protein